MEVPVYVFTGFLDSGKTTLLKDTLSSPDFETERTLIIPVSYTHLEFKDVETFLREIEKLAKKK